MGAEVWDRNFLPRHMNSILVESRDAFRVSAGNTIRDRFFKKRYPPLIPTNLTTNTQELAAFVQVSSGPKAEEINEISRRTVAPIEVQETRTDDPMVSPKTMVVSNHQGTFSSELQHMMQ